MKRQRHRGLKVVYVHEKEKPFLSGAFGCVVLVMVLGMSAVLFFLFMQHLSSGRPW